MSRARAAGPSNAGAGDIGMHSGLTATERRQIADKLIENAPYHASFRRGILSSEKRRARMRTGELYWVRSGLYPPGMAPRPGDVERQDAVDRLAGIQAAQAGPAGEHLRKTHYRPARVIDTRPGEALIVRDLGNADAGAEWVPLEAVRDPLTGTEIARYVPAGLHADGAETREHSAVRPGFAPFRRRAD